ncbi:PdxA family dehydrogenase [Paraburkholderia fungorum]|uniref:PdxA family dehydrogenase n=1 Tax=Paraburkholderia fungorum TaxID=134537 RepID=UPI00241E0053|nr:4-hydroxythreonine-4-phosphate dehydrogenase PdxA [Paraburkholderia fungorum]
MIVSIKRSTSITSEKRNAAMPSTASRPAVGIIIGDPAGIGPEVVAKAWLTGKLHQTCRPLLIGSAAVMERALKFIRKDASIHVLTDEAEVPETLVDRHDTFDILDTGTLVNEVIPLGEDTVTGGNVSGIWLDQGDRLARTGQLAATVMGPISTGSMKMAGTLERVVSVETGKSYLILVSGPLRIAHLTDHIPLRRVCEIISQDLVLMALRQIDSAMREWGLRTPRIAVAGLNPHAMGEEDQNGIALAVQSARKDGINVVGPISPDTVFRHCIEGRYDLVLAMYHDQGHIAIKTWGFSGNIAIILGPPYVHLSVAHGTAYDIVGKGVADHTMILNAIQTAGYLAAGRGFPTSASVKAGE